MASCQQYESKPTLPQGQIVHVSCKAYPDRDMGVVHLKHIRLLLRCSIKPTENWLKVDKGRNTFIFLQPFLVKGVGIDKDAKDEVALVDMNEAVTWKKCEETREPEYGYISRANDGDDEDDEIDEDDEVWTAVQSENSEDGIKIKLLAKEPENPKQLWKIQNVTK